MQLRTCMLSAFILSTAMGFGIAATAADLPKEGTYSVTYSGLGTFKAVPVGKERVLFPWESDGLSVGTGLLDHVTWRCFGLADVTNGMTQWNGYCIGTDSAGDQIVAEVATDGKHAADAKSYNFSAKLTTGTGKYAGISGAYTGVDHSSGFRPAAEGTAHSYSTLQGSYKLP
jgi:hypothetical protein